MMDSATFDAVIEDVRAGVPVRSAIRAHKSNNAAFYRAIDDDASLAERYARAKQSALEAIADDIIEISDDARLDTITGKDGEDRQNSEWIARSRLRVDSRKWILAKLAPKKYGDQLDVKHSGTVNVTLTGRDADVL